MSDDTMLAHLFDDSYAKAGNVIDPTSDALADSFDDAHDPAGEIFDPTGDVPAADLPIHRQIEPIDPTVDMPRHAEVIDPTAEMPVHPPDPSVAATVEMPKEASTSAPDHSSQISMGAFGIDDSAMCQSFSENLENIDPKAIFQTSDKLDGFDDSPTDRNLLAKMLAEVEDETVQSNVDEDNGYSNTLADALSLLQREQEDEFMSSQILEKTAIRKFLDSQDDIDSTPDESEEQETPNKSRTG
jgi:hypothetical protein